MHTHFEWQHETPFSAENMGDVKELSSILYSLWSRLDAHKMSLVN